MNLKVVCPISSASHQTARLPVVIALYFTYLIPITYFKGRAVVQQSEDGCEIVLIHAMKAYGGIDIAPLILNEIVVSRQRHASAALIPRKKPLVLIE